MRIWYPKLRLDPEMDYDNLEDLKQWLFDDYLFNKEFTSLEEWDLMYDEVPSDEVGKLYKNKYFIIEVFNDEGYTQTLNIFYNNGYIVGCIYKDDTLTEIRYSLSLEDVSKIQRLILKHVHREEDYKDGIWIPKFRLDPNIDYQKLKDSTINNFSNNEIVDNFEALYTWDELDQKPPKHIQRIIDSNKSFNICYEKAECSLGFYYDEESKLINGFLYIDSYCTSVHHWLTLKDSAYYQEIILDKQFYLEDQLDVNSEEYLTMLDKYKFKL